MSATAKRANNTANKAANIAENSSNIWHESSGCEPYTLKFRVIILKCKSNEFWMNEDRLSFQRSSQVDSACKFERAKQTPAI